MGFNFRRSKKFGLFNVTLSKSGLGVSVGKGPFRISRGATGRKTFTTGTPIRGLSHRKDLGR